MSEGETARVAFICQLSHQPALIVVAYTMPEFLLAVGYTFRATSGPFEQMDVAICANDKGVTEKVGPKNARLVWKYRRPCAEVG